MKFTLPLLCQNNRYNIVTFLNEWNFEMHHRKMHACAIYSIVGSRVLERIGPAIHIYRSFQTEHFF